MKKNYLIFLLIIITAFQLSGCSNEKDIEDTLDNVTDETIESSNIEVENTEDKLQDANDTGLLDKIEEVIEETTENTEKNKINKPLDIEIKSMSDNGEVNGCEIHNIECEYIVIENSGENEGVDILNTCFYEDALAMLEEYRTYAQETHEEIEERIASGEFDADNSITIYTNKIDIKYNDKGILSIINNLHEKDSIESEERNIKFAITYDVNTGEILYLEDILSGSSKSIEQIVGDAFLQSEYIDDNLKVQYEQEILENVSYVSFYLDEEGLVLYYESGIALPANKGELMAKIPYNDEIFEEIWTVENENESETDKEINIEEEKQ